MQAGAGAGASTHARVPGTQVLDLQSRIGIVVPSHQRPVVERGGKHSITRDTVAPHTGPRRQQDTAGEGRLTSDTHAGPNRP